ncbi:lactonase family protein [Janthinobacterium agaricidamnosum]|uniref:Putative lipoprotein n=1 Tax=Janthinobacterium agaricidamnosum NBRC 102515 = DSM 9628 TaxID=1349767 RepID=W0V5S7_9BURK|nr:beta-propeller fold lactonase family protein [Janthinobacterium agaricidamnosum]CDG84184.1 putative lipoprotein [Janthinobacterium agaricidamnosum NBRC 102515 = DSM 9628]
MIKNFLIASAVATLLAACGGGSDNQSPPIAAQLFAQTNDSDNLVVQYLRNTDGTLTAMAPVKTGGKGTNGVNYFMGNTVAPDALTSNHSVVVSDDGKQLFVANAGDNTVSVFTITPPSGLTLLGVSSTGGIRPTSLAWNNGILYVTHQQGANELGAYRVGADGKLTQLGQYAVLQQDALPTEVSISPDHKFVVVNGFLSSLSPVTPGNTLLAFPINADGTLGKPVNSATVGAGPFGGVFGHGALANVYLTADAAGTTASAYSFAPGGAFTSLSAPVTVTGQKAPCWIAITPDNHFAYVSNGSGAVSQFSLDAGGRLTLVNAAAATEPALKAGGSSFAADAWVSPDGKFLYQDFAGNDKIVVYAIGSDGALTRRGEQTVGSKSGISLQGLAGI